MNPVPIREIVAAAVLAPSSHNTQPWGFSYVDGNLRLYADRTRALTVNDPQDRELTISCGAALFNVRVAAAAAGYTAESRLLPEREDPDLLAAVTFTASSRAPYAPLAEALPLRRTHRQDFEPQTPPDRLDASLDKAVHEHPVELRWVPPGEERQRVASLVAEGDRAQFAVPAWRRELATWMRPRRAEDGLALPWWSAPVIRRVVAHVDVGARTARTDAAATLAAPWVVVLSTDADTPSAWLECGEALQHLLLVAALHGVQAGYANQPCQVAPLRPRVREALAIDGSPQVVLRLGHAPSGRAAPRRPLDRVLLQEQS